MNREIHTNGKIFKFLDLDLQLSSNLNDSVLMNELVCYEESAISENRSRPLINVWCWFFLVFGASILCSVF